MIVVLHVITGLQVGGAESMLTRIVGRSDPDRFRHVVLSLTGPGPVLHRLPASVEVHHVASPTPLGLLTAVHRVARDVRPDVVQTWLYKADLLGALAAGGRPVIWNLRQSRVDSASDSRSNRVVARVNARVARRRARRIVAVSTAAAEAHVSLGYPRDLITVIGNGFDLDRFRPDPEARRRLRDEWGWAGNEFVVGYVGRNHPVKDIPSLLRSFALVAERCPSARFVVVGAGLTSDKLGPGLPPHLDPVLRCVGPVYDVPPVLAAMDLATSSSIGEGFSNTVGEALATGLPVVATDVGNSRDLIGPHGTVVAAGNSDAMGEAIARWVEDGHDVSTSVGRAARRSIGEVHGIDSVVSQYERLWKDVSGCAD